LIRADETTAQIVMTAPQPPQPSSAAQR
jgi:hypothetical protein